MLHYDRIDVSEGIDINKTSASKECDICRYWYFLNYNFKFKKNASNSCHDLLMMSVNLSDIAIWNIKGTDYCCIISWISKNEAINLLQNADLTEISGTLRKSGKLWIKKYTNIFESIYKNGISSKTWWYQNRKTKNFINIKNLLQ